MEEKMVPPFTDCISEYNGIHKRKKNKNKKCLDIEKTAVDEYFMQVKDVNITEEHMGKKKKIRKNIRDVSSDEREKTMDEYYKQERSVIKGVNMIEEYIGKKKKRRNKFKGDVSRDEKEETVDCNEKLSKEITSKMVKKRKRLDDIADISGERKENMVIDEVTSKKRKVKYEDIDSMVYESSSHREDRSESKRKKRKNKDSIKNINECEELGNNVSIVGQKNITEDYKKGRRKNKIVYKQENEINEWRCKNNEIGHSDNDVDYKKEKRKKKKRRKEEEILSLASSEQDPSVTDNDVNYKKEKRKKKRRKEEERLSLASSGQDPSVTVNQNRSDVTGDYLEPRGESLCSQAQSSNSELNSQLTKPPKEKGSFSLCQLSPLKSNLSVHNYNLKRFDNFSDSDVESLESDYADEMYPMTSKVWESRKKKQSEANKSQPVEDPFLLSDLDVPSLLDSYTPNNAPNVADSVDGSRIPGFNSTKCYKYRSYKESLYKFPPGVGVPPEEIEEIPDECSYWPKVESKLLDNNFTEEEIEEEILCKVDKIKDYFERLEKGQLTKEELKEVLPSNFDGPYFPTPRHIKILESLDIKVDWELSPLHQYLMDAGNSVMRYFTLQRRGILFDSSKSKWTEDQLMLKRWNCFQKEYKIFDLRPLMSAKTCRIVGDRDDFQVAPFSYITKENLKKFLLYIGRDLPERNLQHIQMRARQIMTHMKNNQYLKCKQPVTGRTIAKLAYLLNRCGMSYYAPDLLINKYNIIQLQSIYKSNLWSRNIKFRCGLWTAEESDRLKKGVLVLSKKKTLLEASRGKITWTKLLPYVRTRKDLSMREHLRIMIADARSVPKQEKLKISIKLIKLVYESDIDCQSSINWYEAANILKHNNPVLLKMIFYGDYYQVPHKKRLIFEDAITYMYKVILPIKLRKLDVPESVENELSVGSGCGEGAAGADKSHTPARRSGPCPGQVNPQCVDVGESDCVDDPECIVVSELDCSNDPECIVLSESDCSNDPESIDEINNRPQLPSSPHGSLGRAGTSGVKTEKSGKRPSCTEVTVKDHQMSSSDSE